MDSISVHNVHRSFGTARVLQEVSFPVQPGEVFGFLGPNGAGETTTIRIILDIIKADSGIVQLFGQTMSDSVKALTGYLLMYGRRPGIREVLASLRTA